MRKSLSTQPEKAVRCAIYTRKSTEEGLEQEFNSLDAQRDSAEAYAASQKHEGWEIVPETYDDGGFTGSNMERPALKPVSLPASLPAESHVSRDCLPWPIAVTD
jgi:site-specific DNA recombinase